MNILGDIQFKLKNRIPLMYKRHETSFTDKECAREFINRNRSDMYRIFIYYDYKHPSAPFKVVWYSKLERRI